MATLQKRRLPLIGSRTSLFANVAFRHLARVSPRGRTQCRCCRNAPSAQCLLRSVPRRTAIRGRRNSWATMPLRQSRLCFRYAGFVFSKGKNEHRRRDCAAGALLQHRNCVFPRWTYSCRRAKSDVREPIKRSRRYCRVATPTRTKPRYFEKTTPSGRSICTLRYFGRLSIDVCARELSCRAKKEPSVAKQVDHGPRRHCRHGYFPVGLDRPREKSAN